jgi:hypothetical protein
MKQNKILSAAIIAALAGSGGLVIPQQTMAGELDICDGSNCTATTEYTLARELFDDDTVIGPFHTKYKVGDSITTEFYAKFTLDAGSWKENGNSWDVSSDFLTAQTSASGTPPISIVKLEAQTVMFLVKSSGAENEFAVGDELYFHFELENLGELSEGGTVRLTAELETPTQVSVDDKQTIPIFTATQGIDATIIAPTDGNKNAEIDVAAGALQFVGGIDERTALLGTIQVKNKTDIKDKDLNDWSVTDNFDKATFRVEPGPFAASQSHDFNSTEASDKLVFIDVGSSACSYDTGDLAAKEVTDVMALWEIDVATDLSKLEAVSGICVLVPEDNTTTINETTDVPIGLFNVDFGNTQSSFKGRLLHLKQNGTVCTLYNVPNVNANDEVNVRVTNRSSREGTLIGSLRDKDNNYIFRNVKLLGEDTLPPNATVRLTAEQLKEVAISNGHATGDWAGRGVLTITSDLTEMEVFGLLRNNAGGPLLNISVGASGSGCD